MTDTIQSVKAFVRSFLHRSCKPVPAMRAGSGKVHLEVWETASGRTRPVGVEFDHDGVVNLWLVTMHVSADLPNTVLRADKMPAGRKWTDVHGDGANSNLSAYEQFRTKKITRLGVKSIADAELVLDRLAN